ncbi:uncharacterized protein Triagg1_10883 [Trichoderma aggressivum f. europaeum]|uniref:Uncharacterized protein n=1 Tax=Trichoderma aggressivum f. europaeum TaxID=173218 RepID=A0AAE1LW11_9HYPO|nr:hypothetical protein Triagg1_10883 [Trichoderma aggressivum f. europaeum]
MEPQILQQGDVAATQQLDLFDPNLLADITPPNLLLDGTEVGLPSCRRGQLTSHGNRRRGLQPMGIQNPIPFANEARPSVGRASLFANARDHRGVPRPIALPGQLGAHRRQTTTHAHDLHPLGGRTVNGEMVAPGPGIQG